MTKAEILANLMLGDKKAIAEKVSISHKKTAAAANWLRKNKGSNKLSDGPAVYSAATMFHWAESPQGNKFWRSIDNFYVRKSGPQYLYRGSKE